MQRYGIADATGRPLLQVLGLLVRRDPRRRRPRTKRVSRLRLRQFESALFGAIGDSLSGGLFRCPLCRGVLQAPVTAACGHTFCMDCLERTRAADCMVCGTDIASAPACVNVLVQQLLEKWTEKSKALPMDDLMLNTSTILGIQPRYHLRSGFAGLQLDEQTELTLNSLRPEECSRDMSDRRFVTILRNVFKQIEDIREDMLRAQWECVIASDLDCIICSRFILDPVTTGCGHTFCRDCLARVLDHGLACPLCMTQLDAKNYSRGHTLVLDQAIEFLFPEEHRLRVLSNIKESQSKTSDIPVFICTNAFPGVACPLFVYEPRYRLLVRRCLLSPTKKFAMAAKGSTGQKFVSVGTLLEVKDAVHLEDGSFILTTTGVRRFRVVGRDEQDGYDTAKIEVIRDVAVSADQLPELLVLHRRVHEKACKWIRSLTPHVLAEVERLIGRMPKVEKNWLSLPDGPLWTWWLMPILPISSQLQVGFLNTTILEKRLRAIDKMLEKMEVRMKALERNTLTFSEAEDNTESCSESERNFEIPLSSH